MVVIADFLMQISEWNQKELIYTKRLLVFAIRTLKTIPGKSGTSGILKLLHRFIFYKIFLFKTFCYGAKVNKNYYKHIFSVNLAA